MNNTYSREEDVVKFDEEDIKEAIECLLECLELKGWRYLRRYGMTIKDKSKFLINLSGV